MLEDTTDIKAKVREKYIETQVEEEVKHMSFTHAKKCALSRVSGAWARI